MPIKKRSINVKPGYTDYPYLKTINDSNANNPTHKVNEPHNNNLKSITLEDCDQAVFLEFNNRFKIGENDMPIILLDAELTSLREQNYKQYDKDKNYLNGPFFTMFRSESKPKYRTNPANKQAAYVVPEVGLDGNVVYKEYILDGSLAYDLIYEFKFITNYRQYTNEFEQQFRYYFRNKRNIILVNNERFSIGPVDYNSFSNLELVNKDEISQRTYYVSSYQLKLECWIRDLSNMQVRERPNKFMIDFNVSDGPGEGVKTVEQVELPQPKHTNNDPLGIPRRKWNKK